MSDLKERELERLGHQGCHDSQRRWEFLTGKKWGDRAEKPKTLGIWRPCPHEYEEKSIGRIDPTISVLGVTIQLRFRDCYTCGTIFYRGETQGTYLEKLSGQRGKQYGMEGRLAYEALVRGRDPIDLVQYEIVHALRSVVLTALDDAIADGLWEQIPWNRLKK